MPTTWKKRITNEMKAFGEEWGDIVSTTMSVKQANAKFDDGFGGVNGIEFTVWTSSRVYFPACCNGSEWVESVSRNPDSKPTEHIGG